MIGAVATAEVRYYHDELPDWAEYVSELPTGTRYLAGRAPGSSDRGQRSAVLYDRRGNATWGVANLMCAVSLAGCASGPTSGVQESGRVPAPVETSGSGVAESGEPAVSCRDRRIGWLAERAEGDLFGAWVSREWVVVTDDDGRDHRLSPPTHYVVIDRSSITLASLEPHPMMRGCRTDLAWIPEGVTRVAARRTGETIEMLDPCRGWIPFGYIAADGSLRRVYYFPAILDRADPRAIPSSETDLLACHPIYVGACQLPAGASGFDSPELSVDCSDEESPRRPPE